MEIMPAVSKPPEQPHLILGSCLRRFPRHNPARFGDPCVMVRPLETNVHGSMLNAASSYLVSSHSNKNIRAEKMDLALPSCYLHTPFLAINCSDLPGIAGVSCVYAVYCRNSASVFGKTRTPGLHFLIFTASIGLHYLLAQITDARVALLQACCHQRTCSRYASGAHRAVVQRRRLSGLMAMPPSTILATIPSAISAHALASNASTLIGSLALI